LKKIFLLVAFVFVLTACSNTTTSEQTDTNASTSIEQETVSNNASIEETQTEEHDGWGEDPILNEIEYDPVKIIEIMKERVAPITEYSGAVNKLRNDVYLEESTSSSYDLTYTATEVGQYSSDYKFKVHYEQTIEYTDENLMYESYYYPDDVWYLKIALQMNGLILIFRICRMKKIKLTSSLRQRDF